MLELISKIENCKNLCRQQERLSQEREEIEKQKKVLTKKKPIQTNDKRKRENDGFIKPIDKPNAGHA